MVLQSSGTFRHFIDIRSDVSKRIILIIIMIRVIRGVIVVRTVLDVRIEIIKLNDSYSRVRIFLVFIRTIHVAGIVHGIHISTIPPLRTHIIFPYQ